MRHHSFVQNRAFLILIWVYFLAGISMPALAQSAKTTKVVPPILSSPARTLKDLDLKADDISRDYETRTIILEGNVVISFGSEKISCQKAVINMRTQDIIATGGVELESETIYIEGEKIKYNYSSRLAIIEKGLVQSGQVVFIGDLIEKKSETLFLATSAKYTSCATCPPGWSITGQSIEAEIGGYAYIKYPVLRLMDFPILVLPRMLVPLKTQRQSGVLVPSWNYSKLGGTALSLPFYWVISDSQDITYTAKSYKRRGLKHNIEYRYKLSKNSSGEMHTSYIEDRAFSPSGDIEEESDQKLVRGFLDYKHHYVLPNNYVQRVNFNIASDLRYPRDYSDEMQGHGDSALENQISLTKSEDNHLSSIEATYFTNLLKSNALAENSDAVHKIPEINYKYIDTEILDTNLFFKFDFNYTNFARRDFAYDDVTGTGDSRTIQTARDGSFDPTIDQIRTGQRFIFQPAISYPFHFAEIVDVYPLITYSETQYRFNTNPDTPFDNYSRNTERRYLQMDLSMKSKLNRLYGDELKSGSKYKHEIESEMIYSHIPWADRPDHLFFGDYENLPYSQGTEPLSNSDFFGTTKVQFDYKDRLYDQELMTFVLSNYLIEKKMTSAGPSYQKFATFRLSQSYDFNNARRQESSYPWSAISSLLDVRTKHIETHSYANIYPYAKVTNWYSRLRYITLMRNYYEISYSRNVILTTPEEYNIDSRTEYYGLGIGYKSKYMDLLTKLSQSAVTAQLESWEYVLSFKPPGDCWSIQFGERKKIGADKDYNLSFNFNYGGF
jgi:LPS-assembly protein